ncbi:hypothetical protein MBLNU459_g5169t1 [Dothideomycetes sp. NU459]
MPDGQVVVVEDVTTVTVVDVMEDGRDKTAVDGDDERAPEVLANELDAVSKKIPEDEVAENDEELVDDASEIKPDMASELADEFGVVDDEDGDNTRDVGTEKLPD